MRHVCSPLPQNLSCSQGCCTAKLFFYNIWLWRQQKKRAAVNNKNFMMSAPFRIPTGFLKRATFETARQPLDAARRNRSNSQDHLRLGSAPCLFICAFIKYLVYATARGAALWGSYRYLDTTGKNNHTQHMLFSRQGNEVDRITCTLSFPRTIFVAEGKLALGVCRFPLKTAKVFGPRSEDFPRRATLLMLLHHLRRT